MTRSFYPPPNSSAATSFRPSRFGLPPIQTYIQYPAGTELGNPPTDAEDLFDPYMSHMYAVPLATFLTPSPPSNSNNGLTADATVVSPRFNTMQSFMYPDMHFLIAYDSVEQNNFSFDVRRSPREDIPHNIYSSFRELWISRERPTFIRIVSEEFPWPIDIKVAVPSEPSSAEGQAQPRAPDIQAPSASGSASDTSQSPHRTRTQAHTPPQGVTQVQGGGNATPDVGVSCGDVWKALYYNLRQPIMDSELAILRSAARDSMSAHHRLGVLLDAAQRRARRAGGGPEHSTLRRVDWLGRKTLFVGLRKDTDGRVSATALLPDREPCEETWVAVFKERP